MNQRPSNNSSAMINSYA